MKKSNTMLMVIEDIDYEQENSNREGLLKEVSEYEQLNSSPVLSSDQISEAMVGGGRMVDISSNYHSAVAVKDATLHHYDS